MQETYKHTGFALTIELLFELSFDKNVLKNFCHWLGQQTIAKGIKTSGSESRGQEEAASTRVFRPMRPLQGVIYTDGRPKFLKCCSSAAITPIA